MSIEDLRLNQIPLTKGVNTIIDKYQYLNSAVLEILKKQCKNDFFCLTLESLEELDPETVKHVMETGNLAFVVGAEKGYADNELEEFIIAAIDYDLGKSAVNNEVLKKQGKLTDNEFKEIEEHAIFSKIIAEKTANNTSGAKIGRMAGGIHKHKKNNGYPEAIKFQSNEENEKSKILSIIDCFHTMISYRPFKKSIELFKLEDCVNEIKNYIKDINSEDEKIIKILFDFYSKNFDHGKKILNFSDKK